MNSKKSKWKLKASIRSKEKIFEFSFGKTEFYSVFREPLNNSNVSLLNTTRWKPKKRNENQNMKRNRYRSKRKSKESRNDWKRLSKTILSKANVTENSKNKRKTLPIDCRNNVWIWFGNQFSFVFPLAKEKKDVQFRFRLRRIEKSRCWSVVSTIFHRRTNNLNTVNRFFSFTIKCRFYIVRRNKVLRFSIRSPTRLVTLTENWTFSTR